MFLYLLGFQRLPNKISKIDVNVNVKIKFKMRMKNKNKMQNKSRIPKEGSNTHIREGKEIDIRFENIWCK